MRRSLLLATLISLQVLAGVVSASDQTSLLERLLTIALQKKGTSDVGKREHYEGIATCMAPPNNWWYRWFKGFTFGQIQTWRYNYYTGRGWYGDNTQCEWRICVPKGKVVHLSFEGPFYVEGHMGHCKDKIRIGDGEQKDSPLIKVLCGEGKRPKPVQSTGNCMNVYFTSDGSVHGTGFRATFLAIDKPYTPSKQIEVVDSINPPNCGIRQPTKRIMNGELSDPGEWPWMAHIKLYASPFRWKQCGGNIINKQWVLTAAHCLEKDGEQQLDPSVYTFGFGEHRTDQYETSEVTVKAKKFFIHPQRNTRLASQRNDAGPHDIALVKLEKPLVFNKYISPICLPTRKNMFTVGTDCVASGWGKERHGEQLSPKLKHTEMDVKPWSACKNTFGTNAFEDIICAQAPRGSLAHACQGDSGGPLACPISENGEERFYLAGATSIVIYCGQQTHTTPTEFVSTEYYMDWIINIIKKN